jgi:uncharacterized protein (DUF2141 family)
VYLQWSGAPRSGAVAITNGSGLFKFDSLPAGDYDLRAVKEGVGSASYGGINGSIIGQPIPLKDGELRSDFVLRLLRPATISGTVRDRDGDPLVGAQVQIYKEAFPRGTRGLVQRMASRTNDRGEYRITNLEAGKYFVAASQPNVGMLMQTPDSPNVVFMRQFYGGASDWKRATPVSLPSGGDLRGIDFQLVEARAITLKGTVVGIPEVQFRAHLMDRAVRKPCDYPDFQFR